MADDPRVKHLEMIQGTVNRLAGNCFAVKGWAVTLVAAILALDKAGSAAEIAFLPVVAFWWLDSLYLRQERMFRKLHEAVAKDLNQDGPAVASFDMNQRQFENQVKGRLATMGAETVWPLYGVLALVVSIVLLVSR